MREYIDGTIVECSFDSMTGMTTLGVDTDLGRVNIERTAKWAIVCELMMTYVLNKECELVKTQDGWAFERLI